jgi:long-chain acyl-CoA synthetase
MTHRLLTRSLERAVRANGERIALNGEGVELTYGQLWARACAVTERLRAVGVAPDDTVMVKSSNHPLDFACLLGVWMASAVAVPVHRTSPAGVVDAIQAKARCRFHADLLEGTGVDGGIRPMDPSPPHDAADRALLAGAALVIFTSGSTGLPKGVVLSHEAFAGKLEQNQRLLGLGADDVTLLVLNNTFSFGIWMALLTLMQGGKVVTCARFSPPLFVDLLVDEGVTRVGVVPTMVRATFGAMPPAELDAAAARIRAAARLRDVVIGGEPLGPELSARLRAFIAPAGLYDIYGLTETSTSDFVLAPRDYPGHPATIGRPAPGVRCRIVNDAGEACADGASGELQLQTPYIMAGYLGDPELSHAAFADGWFRTGDLATRDADGFVSIVGRLKELIVRGGNKITPIEVERALCACTGVGAALVAGVADPVLGQRIHALLVADAGAKIDASALRAELAVKLEKYKHPDACYVGSELPTGRTGKIDRGQLQSLLRTDSLSPLAAWSR